MHYNGLETGYTSKEHNGEIIVLAPEEFLIAWLDGGHPEATNGVWDKLYKAELFDEIRFDESMRTMEDIPFTLQMLHRIDAIAIIYEPLYRYWYYGTSLSNVVAVDNVGNRLKAYLMIDKFIAEKLDREQAMSLINRITFRYSRLIHYSYNYLDKTDRAPLLRKITDRLKSIYAKDHACLALKYKGFIFLAVRLPWLCDVVCHVIHEINKARSNAKMRVSVIPYDSSQ
jgi:hypothetical protein